MQDCTDPLHETYRFITDEIELAWFNKLNGTAYSLKIPGDAKTAERLVDMHGELLRAVAVVNLKVYTMWYNEILNRIETQTEGS